MISTHLICTHEVVIFMYHHVHRPSRDVTMRGLYVTPAHFAYQLRQLRRLPVRFLTFADIAEQTYPPDDPFLWVMLTFDDGSAGLYHHAFPLLQKYQIPAVIYPVADDLGKKLVIWEECGDKTPNNMLSPAHVQEMAQAGIEFGSHLCHHVHATRLSPAHLEQELVESRAVLERLSGTPPLSIAYPFGNYDQTVMEAAEAAGYRFGVTTRPGINLGRHALELHRIAVKGTRWHHYFYFWQQLRAMRYAMNSRLFNSD